MRHIVLAALAAASLLGCGGTSDPTPPTCQPGELKVIGTLDGTAISQNLSPITSGFGQPYTGADGPKEGSYSAGILDGSGHPITVVKVAFSKVVVNGGTTDARGYVDFTPLSGPSAGNCETGGFDSTLSMNPDGNGGTFILRNLNASPYCSGAAKDGVLAGCFEFAN
jgi:hypothetical protein